jgi:chromosome segregation ATPase
MSDLPEGEPSGEVEEVDAEEQDAELPEEGGDDAADEGDEGEEGQEGDVDPEPRRGGGGASTPRTLRRRAQEAERERDELRGRNAATEQRLRDVEARVASNPAAAQQAAQQEQEMLQRMSGEEQTQYFYQKGRREVANELQQIRNVQADQTDRMAYASRAAASPMRAQFSDRVEAVLQQARAQGRNESREVIYKYLLGDEMDRKAAKAVPGQRKAAAARVASQRARPGGARGDAAPAARDSRNDPESAMAEMRRRNVPLW